MEWRKEKEKVWTVIVLTYIYICTDFFLFDFIFVYIFIIFGFTKPGYKDNGQLQMNLKKKKIIYIERL